jgi:protein gp37
MTDLFGAWVPDEWIKEVFKACEKAPQHRYLFLTKNPKRYIELAVEGVLVFGAEKWYGTTITDESDAGRVRIMEKAICESPLSNAFLSIEPLLGKIDIDSAALESINWLIIGAETGNRKGKIIPRREWVELICAAADKHRIPVFMKRGELLNGKAVKAGMEEPRYFMKELMGTGFRQEFPWEMEK